MAQPLHYLNWNENRGLYIIGTASFFLSIALAFGLMQAADQLHRSGKFPFLQQDILFFGNGDKFCGLITAEDKENLCFKSDMGIVDFKKTEIKEIKRDYYARLLREVW